MKRMLFVVVSLGLFFFVASCSKNPTSPSTNDNSSSSSSVVSVTRTVYSGTLSVQGAVTVLVSGLATSDMPSINSYLYMPAGYWILAGFRINDNQVSFSNPGYSSYQYRVVVTK